MFTYSLLFLLLLYYCTCFSKYCLQKNYILTVNISLYILKIRNTRKIKCILLQAFSFLNFNICKDSKQQIQGLNIFLFNSILYNIYNSIIIHNNIKFLKMLNIHAQSLQSYLTLCDTLDCSPPVSPAHGSFQARVQSGLLSPPPGDPSQPRDQTHISCISCIAGDFFTTGSLGKPKMLCTHFHLSFVLSRNILVYFSSQQYFSSYPLTNFNYTSIPISFTV